MTKITIDTGTNELPVRDPPTAVAISTLNRPGSTATRIVDNLTAGATQP